MRWTTSIRIQNRGHSVHHQYANYKMLPLLMLPDMHRVQSFFALIDVTQGAILNNCHTCNIHLRHQYSPNKCQLWLNTYPSIIIYEEISVNVVFCFCHVG